jgi:hypothetical protein
MKNITYLLVLIALTSACKQEPVYQLKDPYGDDTMSAKADEFEDTGVDVLKVKKKNFDRQKWNEIQRKEQALKKIVKQAREYDPSGKKQVRVGN